MPRVQHEQGQKNVLWEKIIKTMQSLYIIGNGFDSYGHNMPTQYSDFRQYLVNRFPEYQRDYGGTLEFTVQNDGSELYDMNEVVGAIIRTIDECSKPGWGKLITAT